jgi:hypothetical protein
MRGEATEHFGFFPRETESLALRMVISGDMGMPGTSGDRGVR